MVRIIHNRLLMAITAFLAILLSTTCENALSEVIALDEEYSKKLLGFDIQPGEDRWITGHEIIKIVFEDTLNTSTLELGGTLGITDEDIELVDWATGTRPQDTLYLNPARIGGLWPVGTSRTLVVTATSATGKVVEGRVLRFDVEYALCVDDTAQYVGIEEDGTVRHPFGAIQDGIDEVATLYSPGAGATIPVRVAVGTYSKACNFNTAWVANLPGGVSLDGGYRGDFSGYAVSGVTELYNSGIATSGDSYGPTSVLFCGPSVSDGAEIKNLTVRPGGNSSSTGVHGGIHVKDSNPVLRNITVVGATTGGPPNVVGIAIQNDCSPIIQNPIIDPGHASEASIGLMIRIATPTITGTDPVTHRIAAGKGVSNAYGIVFDRGGGTVSGITIAGPADFDPNGSIYYNNKGGCVYLTGGVTAPPSYPTISGNRFTMHASWNLHAVYEGDAFGDPAVFTGNDFALSSSTGIWYRDHDTSTDFDEGTHDNLTKTNQITFGATTGYLCGATFGNFSSTRNINYP